MIPILPGLILAFVYFITSDGKPNGLLFITVLVFAIGAIIVLRQDEIDRHKDNDGHN